MDTMDTNDSGFESFYASRPSDSVLFLCSEPQRSNAPCRTSRATANRAIRLSNDRWERPASSSGSTELAAVRHTSISSKASPRRRRVLCSSASATASQRSVALLSRDSAAHRFDAPLPCKAKLGSKSNTTRKRSARRTPQPWARAAWTTRARSSRNRSTSY